MVVVYVVLINDKQPGQVRSGTETSSGEFVKCFNQQHRSRVGRMYCCWLAIANDTRMYPLESRLLNRCFLSLRSINRGMKYWVNL